MADDEMFDCDQEVKIAEEELLDCDQIKKEQDADIPKDKGDSKMIPEEKIEQVAQNQEYEVEDIRGRFTDHQNSWEPVENLSRAKHLIEKYEKQLEREQKEIKEKKDEKTDQDKKETVYGHENEEILEIQSDRDIQTKRKKRKNSQQEDKQKEDNISEFSVNDEKENDDVSDLEEFIEIERKRYQYDDKDELWEEHQMQSKKNADDDRFGVFQIDFTGVNTEYNLQEKQKMIEKEQKILQRKQKMLEKEQAKQLKKQKQQSKKPQQKIDLTKEQKMIISKYTSDEPLKKTEKPEGSKPKEDQVDQKFKVHRNKNKKYNEMISKYYSSEEPQKSAEKPEHSKPKEDQEDEKFKVPPKKNKYKKKSKQQATFKEEKQIEDTRHTMIQILSKRIKDGEEQYFISWKGIEVVEWVTKLYLYQIGQGWTARKYDQEHKDQEKNTNEIKPNKVLNDKIDPNINFKFRSLRSSIDQSGNKNSDDYEEGTFHKNDVIQDVQIKFADTDDGSTNDPNKYVYKIYWEQRKDGVQPTPSFCTYQNLKRHQPYYILKFWEQLYIKNRSQQQNMNE